MSLKDTLANLQQREQQKAQWERDKPALIKAWQEDVANLLKEIRSYLAEYEADHSMSFSEREIELSEEGLGKYRVKAMSIVAGPTTVMMDPVGRMILGAQGRVDMYRQGHRREQDRVLILRVPTSKTDSTLQWVTYQPPEIGTPRGGSGLTRLREHGLPIPQQRRRVPLDKAILENHLEYLLSK